MSGHKEARMNSFLAAAMELLIGDPLLVIKRGHSPLPLAFDLVDIFIIRPEAAYSSI